MELYYFVFGDQKRCFRVCVRQCVNSSVGSVCVYTHAPVNPTRVLNVELVLLSITMVTASEEMTRSDESCPQ